MDTQKEAFEQIISELEKMSATLREVAGSMERTNENLELVVVKLIEGAQ